MATRIESRFSTTESVRVSLSILNLTDVDPANVGPTIGGTSNNSGNTHPQSYDAIGRYMTRGVNMRF
jgi:outer membrane receptor protein involved in Fe transport